MDEAVRMSHGSSGKIVHGDAHSHGAGTHGNLDTLKSAGRRRGLDTAQQGGRTKAVGTLTGGIVEGSKAPQVLASVIDFSQLSSL